MAWVGFLLATATVVAAIFAHFPYWYTPFTIGSFLWFDWMSERWTGRSTAQLVRREGWRSFVSIYVVAVGLGFIVDVVYGRTLAYAWVYPPWRGIANVAVPVLFHYPFGMLALYATFQTARGVTGSLKLRRLDAKPTSAIFQAHNGGLDSALLRIYAPVSLVALALCVVTPLLNFWLDANRGAGELLFIVMLVSTVAFDGVREALTGNSMLRELLANGWRYAAAIVVTLVWAVLVNEGPNVFAREWVYLIHPFGLPLWLILLLGWPFLLTVSVAVYETTSAWTARRSSRNFVGMEAGHANHVAR
jgi:hypothetical protein